MSSITTTSFESSLRALERQLGLETDDDPTKQQQQQQQVGRNENDWSRRLSVLEQRVQQSLKGNTTSSSLQETWAESTKLMEQLDPGVALTHQQQIAVAPILYRREEILVSSSEFKRDLEQCAEILSLLLISSSQQPPPKKDDKITEQQVTQAPILNAIQISDQDKERLDAITKSVLDMQEQTERATARLDNIVDEHHSLVSAINEKLILLDEKLRQREQK